MLAWKRAINLVFSEFFQSRFPNFHTGTKAVHTTHAAIAGQQVVAAGDWLHSVLQCVEPACMFNTPLGPVSTKQDQQHVATGDVLPRDGVVEAVAASAGRGDKGVDGLF